MARGARPWGPSRSLAAQIGRDNCALDPSPTLPSWTTQTSWAGRLEERKRIWSVDLRSDCPGLDPGSRAACLEGLREIPAFAGMSGVLEASLPPSVPYGARSAFVDSSTWSCGSGRERYLRSRSQRRVQQMGCPDGLGRALREERRERGHAADPSNTPSDDKKFRNR